MTESHRLEERRTAQDLAVRRHIGRVVKFYFEKKLNSGKLMKVGIVFGLGGFFLALLGAGLSFASDSFVGLWMVRAGVVLGWAGALVFFIYKSRR